MPLKLFVLRDRHGAPVALLGSRAFGPLKPGAAGRDLPPMKSPLRISPEHLGLFTTGRRPRPALSADFPAQRIETALTWDDLILHPGTLKQIRELQDFITHGQTLMHKWGMAARLWPGHRALFHGPPGTGKTLSVALLGKASKHDVYRVDLSLVVSVLASNMRENLDPAFTRRFESLIFFPLPRAAERLQIWKRFSPHAVLDPKVNLLALAEAHELSGGSIMNVIRQVSLASIAEGERPITGDDLKHAIHRELAKEGKGS